MIKIQLKFTFLQVTMVLAYLSVNGIYVKHKDRTNFMKCLHHEVCDKLKVEHKKVIIVSLDLLYKVNRLKKRKKTKEIHQQREIE